MYPERRTSFVFSTTPPDLPFRAEARASRSLLSVVPSPCVLCFPRTEYNFYHSYFVYCIRAFDVQVRGMMPFSFRGSMVGLQTCPKA